MAARTKKKTTSKVAAPPKPKARPKSKPKPKPKPKVKRATRGVVLRLERGEGATRTFWEVTRSQSKITTRFGRHLSAGRSVTKEYDDKATAEAAFAKAASDKRAEGYGEPAPKQIIGGSSRKGVVSRNLDLEALIEEDPSDLQRYLVYADWLQQQSDPRGELIVAQHGLETSTNNRELDSLEHIEAELLKQFGDELLGEPLAKLAHVRSYRGSSHRGFAWRCGFLRAARMQPYQARLSAGEAIALLLEHPSSRFLECLVIQGGTLIDACSALQAKMPKTLTTLAISNDYRQELTLSPIAALMPMGLRKLWLTGGFIDVEMDVVVGLEELDVAVADPETLEAIAKTTWSSLKRAHLTFSVIDDVDMANLLTQIIRRMPVVEHLTLRRWLIGESRDLQHQDALAKTILEVFKTEKSAVTRLDLEMALSKHGAEELVPLLRELPRSIRLHVPKLAVKDPVTRAVYSGELNVVFVDEEPEERARDNINPFHHTKEML